MRPLNLLALLIIPVLTLAGLTSVHSRSLLTPTLSLKESFVNNRTVTLDESGHVTTIAPGISYQAVGAKNSLSIDYSLNAIYYDGLSQQDRVDHSLQLQSAFDHIPNRWDTSITGSIKQANVGSDDKQSVNPIFQSDNSQELRTLGISSNLQGTLTDQIDYQSGIKLDYIDFENSGYSNSIGFNLGLSSDIQNKFSWGATFTSNHTSLADIDSQIDMLKGNLNYRFNRYYSSFLSADKSEADNDFLNDVNTNIGIVWTPDRNTSFRLGSGKRGNSTSYILASSLNTRHTIYRLDYDETITTPRALLINDATNQQSVTALNQTLSIAPVLVKKGTIGMTVKGKRTNVTLSYFKQTTIQNNDNVGQEIRDSLSISANRALSDRSSVQLTLARQVIETIQENEVDDASLSYNKQLSKTINTSAEFRVSEQKSNIVANQFRLEDISFKLHISF
jgi:hypothetical protein